ncbi:MAG TPA: DUF4129 domain-containing protein [Solirubrobacteraceae bacterium]|nr:DUF4129 domain-containing protein [Solirubrobacteraceae bacterium]
MRPACALLACALLACGAAPARATASAPGDTRVADRAREQARDVLSQPRFQPTRIGAPLRDVRERIGAALRPLGRFEAAFRWVAGWLPGGRAVLWALLGLLVFGGFATAAARVARRTAAAETGAGGHGDDPERVSAARLRAQAERGERDGDLELALRLRFRAGLVELDSRELIELRPALTNRELLRDVPSPTLAGLVSGFESVAYGGRPAAPEDVRDAREGWPRVPGEAGPG